MMQALSGLHFICANKSQVIFSKINILCVYNSLYGFNVVGIAIAITDSRVKTSAIFHKEIFCID